MHAVIEGLAAREIGRNHHATILSGDDHRGWGIGADWSKNLDLIDGSTIQPVTTFHRIPIMRICPVNTHPQCDRCSKEQK